MSKQTWMKRLFVLKLLSYFSGGLYDTKGHGLTEHNLVTYLNETLKFERCMARCIPTFLFLFLFLCITKDWTMYSGFVNNYTFNIWHKLLGGGGGCIWSHHIRSISRVIDRNIGDSGLKCACSLGLEYDKVQGNTQGRLKRWYLHR